ncbi:hypothetical protein [Phenylobacterium sp. J367]|uniref:hypothetical protein n=1 Tax=Phenylobacterium sp. J367 TaxID=2898435 RepID=UPI002151AFCF|nr:hypothetical protein [Phenylobacterium sp. J367]MCR5877639.1 hypothetical protein [Phenylobacterium sp. J367]
MIHGVVFSKDRPLQLMGYLDSLAALGGREQLARTRVVVPALSDDYRQVERELLAIHGVGPSFVEEGERGFDATVRELVAGLPDDEFIFFGCDDVVFLRPFTLAPAPAILNADPELIGVSLRLGLNIKHRPPAQPGSSAMVYKWRWVGAPWHWGYPFELMASVYRAGLVKEVLGAVAQKMRTPNDLEHFGVIAAQQILPGRTPKMAMFNSDNYAAAQDVNMVQAEYRNYAVGGADYAPETLNRLYREGRRLDWTAAFGTSIPDCFLRDMRWRIR